MSVQLVTLLRWSLIAVLLAPVLAHAQASRPLQVSNLSPPVAIAGLPLWRGAPESFEIGWTTEIANHYRLRQKGGDYVILDGETLRTRVQIEQPFGDGWSFGANVPLYRQSGGVLDDVVDGWHSLFNMPDGSRNLRPEGVLEFDIGTTEGQFFGLDESASGVGDIQLSITRALGADSGWFVRSAVKLPTGRKSVLAGSGGTDLSVSLMRLRDTAVRGRAAGYYYGLGLVDVEQPDNIRFPVQDLVATGLFGGGLAFGTRFGVKAQIDVHSGLYDSRLEETGQTSVMATIGCWLDIGDRTLFEFAVSEDLHVSTTPDVVLVLSLNWQQR